MNGRRQRRGFVLLTILGVIVSLALLSLGVALAGRSALASARNRAALGVAEWRAEGCIERVRAAVYDAMTSVPPDGVIAVWDSVNRVVAASPLVRAVECTVTARAAGAGLHVNDADADQLRRFFMALHIPAPRADSLADALLDWRDGDTIPRSLGAERGWYTSAHRPAPRDSQFADVREIVLVRGFEHFGDTLALLTTESARMPLSHVPLSVLASLPGITPAALAHAADLRRRGERISELSALGATLPKDAQLELMRHYTELSQRTAAEPEAWVISARAAAGDPPVQATVEVQFARAGTRVAILRRR